ncbi:hypothetical protein KS4_22560 [Poriferisphaera corsica]|uniref:Uncharacterized protein n=1 Tax=Poriferisphaera corsica TaxID=2528020 RepID=A0A517YVC3_9BACT|nr:hypothetical protein [Poriferisphaera corsica]QDU34193.1 hypothetical protein KS4_22560 [Poriferisphaera corsica]
MTKDHKSQSENLDSIIESPLNETAKAYRAMRYEGSLYSDIESRLDYGLENNEARDAFQMMNYRWVGIGAIAAMLLIGLSVLFIANSDQGQSDTLGPEIATGGLKSQHLLSKKIAGKKLIIDLPDLQIVKKIHDVRGKRSNQSAKLSQGFRKIHFSFKRSRNTSPWQMNIKKRKQREQNKKESVL